MRLSNPQAITRYRRLAGGDGKPVDNCVRMWTTCPAAHIPVIKAQEL
jgi:hypothetical protein